jgi:hypothetical protein
MALPVTPNTTCDIYHDPAVTPPAAADVAGARIYLTGDYRRYLDAVEGDAQWKFTHVALVELTLDIRDRYSLGTPAFTHYDTLWVPDGNGTAYTVVFVERVGRGTSLDHKRAYLLRDLPPWPNDTFV